MPYFPQELVDAIIKCVKTDGTDRLQMSPLVFTTLLSCALVSQSFSAPARKHLFCSVTLGPYQSAGEWSLRRVLRSPQDVARRIKSLEELLANQKSDLRHLITNLCVEVDEAQTIFDDSSSMHTALRILLSTACNLKAFQLVAKIQSVLSSALSWTTIRTEVKELLTTICHSPSIKTLHLAHFSDVPIDLILGNPCIDSLFLVQTKFSNFPALMTSSSVEVAAPPTFKRLNIGFYLSEFCDHFLTVDRIFSNIEDFGTSIRTQKEVRIFKTVLKRMPPSLKSLNLVFWEQTFEGLIRSLDMYNLRRLRTVMFSLVLGNEEQSTSMANIKPSRWFTFLNDINIPAQIVDVTILVRLSLTQDEILTFQDLPDFNEEREKVVLSVFNTGEFPVMKNLLFYLIINIREVPGQQITTFNAEEIRGNVETRMLSLLIPPKAGKIQVTIICNLV